MRASRYVRLVLSLSMIWSLAGCIEENPQRGPANDQEMVQMFADTLQAEGLEAACQFIKDICDLLEGVACTVYQKNCLSVEPPPPTSGADPSAPQGTPDSILNGPRVTSFTLINADSDLPINGYDPLADGSEINLTVLATQNVSIRANVSGGTPGQVIFTLSGAESYNHTEREAPYALKGDSSGDYAPWTPSLGSYTLSATVDYSGDYSISFSISSSSNPPASEVEPPPTNNPPTSEVEPPSESTGTRDPYHWPFAADSIWNTPLGSQADYVPVSITMPNSVGTDEDIIIMRPNAPMTEIKYTKVSWGSEARVDGARCKATGGTIVSAPIPAEYVFYPPAGSTPNAGVAVLLSDGRTIMQGQPFSRCYANSYATMTYGPWPNEDLYGDGRGGAHGGSGLSAIGGSIRYGELTRGVIRHALKINLWGKRELYYSTSDKTPGYRWPAFRADAYASSTYGGKNPVLEMGALLALQPSFDVNSLKTKPARIVAQTLKTFGAYVVDDTAWDHMALSVETGPDGDVRDEFNQLTGMKMSAKTGTSQAWYDDMKVIISKLHVVNNNTPDTVGGPGTRLAPLAPPFGKPGSGW